MFFKYVFFFFYKKQPKMIFLIIILKKECPTVCGDEGCSDAEHCYNCSNEIY